MELTQRTHELQIDSTTGWIQCAITGIAGCGKSELAKTYASEYELKDNLKVFKWRLDPDPTNNQASKMYYRQAFKQLLSNFGIQDVKPFEDENTLQTQQRLNRILWRKITEAKYSHLIVIFDNAGSYKDIKEYWPMEPTDLSECKTQGHILVTTQNPHFLPK